MSQPPPYQPPYQPPSYPPGQAYGQPPGAPPGYYPGTPSGGPARRRPWGLVVGALVVGLVIGGGTGAGVVLATGGDPEDSEEYQALEDDLRDAEASLDSDPAVDETDEPTAVASTTAEPSEPSELSEPSEPSEPSGDTIDVDGWNVTEPLVFSDDFDDFTATFQATNATGAPAPAVFTLTLSNIGRVVTEMTCNDPLAQDGPSGEVPVGQTVAIECLSFDDFVDGGYDAVEVTYAF